MLDSFHIEQMDMGATLWVAQLSDGMKIYQDDGRPGHALSAWARLRNCLKGRTIVSLGMRFRKREVFIGDAAWLQEVKPRGCFFVRKQEGFVGSRMRHVYVQGWIIGEKIYCEEREERLLTLLRSEIRQLELDHPGVILWA